MDRYAVQLREEGRVFRRLLMMTTDAQAVKALRELVSEFEARADAVERQIAAQLDAD